MPGAWTGVSRAAEGGADEGGDGGELRGSVVRGRDARAIWALFGLAEILAGLARRAARLPNFLCPLASEPAEPRPCQQPFLTLPPSPAMSATKKMSSSSSSATKRSNAVASSSAGPSKKKARTSAPSASTSASGSKAAPAAGPDSSFSYRTTRMRLSVPPRFTGDLRQGVEEMLDSMVMRCVPYDLTLPHPRSHSASLVFRRRFYLSIPCPFRPAEGQTPTRGSEVSH